MVHRPHPNSFIPIAKSHSFPSANAAMCSSPPPMMFSSQSGHGDWSFNTGQAYDNHFSSPPPPPPPPHSSSSNNNTSEYQRRWVSEQEMHLRSRSHHNQHQHQHHHRINTPHSQNQHPTHTDLSPAPIAVSTEFLRSTSLQGSYPRPSSEITVPHMSNSYWDIDNNNNNEHTEQHQRFNNGPSSWATNPLNLQLPQFTPQQFDNMLFSAPDNTTTTTSLYTPPPSHDQATLNGFSFPHRLSPVPSPSPSPTFYSSVKQASPVGSSASHDSRRSSFDRSEPRHNRANRSCSHCHATTTPLWRRDPSTMKPLCNACGLYLQQRNKLRPQELIDADDDGTTSEDESDAANYVGPECTHCRTHHTSVWRRSKTGEQLCNACGVYARLRGKPRPLSLKRNKIRPRSKHLPTTK